MLSSSFPSKNQADAPAAVSAAAASENIPKSVQVPTAASDATAGPANAAGQVDAAGPAATTTSENNENLRRRGQRAGKKIQQERFMKFLYQLSSARKLGLAQGPQKGPKILKLKIRLS